MAHVNGRVVRMVKIPLKDVAAVEAKRTDAAATVLVVVGISAVLYGVASFLMCQPNCFEFSFERRRPPSVGAAAFPRPVG